MNANKPLLSLHSTFTLSIAALPQWARATASHPVTDDSMRLARLLPKTLLPSPSQLPIAPVAGLGTVAREVKGKRLGKQA
jgi:hypothetical protein